MPSCGYDERKIINEKEKELEEKFPTEAMYNSRCTLWTEGLLARIVDRELYNKAKTHYGRSWTYVGD